jgi:hypothetical protein
MQLFTKRELSVDLCLAHWFCLWIVPLPDYSHKSDFDSGLFCLPDFDTQILDFSWYEDRAHRRCDQSTWDAYSSKAPDPTSGIYPEFCVCPILWSAFPYFPYLWVMTIHYICNFISKFRFNIKFHRSQTNQSTSTKLISMRFNIIRMDNIKVDSQNIQPWQISTNLEMKH